MNVKKRRGQMYRSFVIGPYYLSKKGRGYPNSPSYTTPLAAVLPTFRKHSLIAEPGWPEGRPGGAPYPYRKEISFPYTKV